MYNYNLGSLNEDLCHSHIILAQHRVPAVGLPPHMKMFSEINYTEYILALARSLYFSTWTDKNHILYTNHTVCLRDFSV